MTTDRAVLSGQAYADASRLAARISIYEYQRPWIDLVGVALAELGPVDGPVLDIGWGTGMYTNRLRAERPGRRVIPVDLSIGMAPEVVGEVDRLPFADDSAGAVLAMHMLYYATDPASAVEELRRVLRPGGGRLLASTNAADDKPELADLWTASLEDLGVADPPPYPGSRLSFTLEHGVDLVGATFGRYDVAEFRSELVIPDPGPVLAFVESASAEFSGHLPFGVPWSAYRAAAARRVLGEVERTGAFRITGHVGVLSASA